MLFINRYIFLNFPIWSRETIFYPMGIISAEKRQQKRMAGFCCECWAGKLTPNDDK